MTAATALAASSVTASARLASVTSPVARGNPATLVARVSSTKTCSITVYYKSGTSRAKGLTPKTPVSGLVSWTWLVGGNTTPGRWPIQVSCGSAGSFHTAFKVTG